MKAFLCSVILVVHSSLMIAQNVNIPDANFKSILLLNSQINTNNDGEIQTSEAVAYTGMIDCGSRSIQTLIGIEAFKNLTGLNSVFNQLTSIDVSQNVKLQSLNVIGNQLTSIDVSKNIALTTLQCDNNKLTAIDVSKNVLLRDLWVGNNFMTNLDISKNTALKSLYAYNNAFQNLDVSNNLDLGFFMCNRNLLTNLNLSKNDKLYYFVANKNKLTSLDVKNGSNTLMTYFDVSENFDLTCVQVDNVNYSNINWTNKEAVTNYSTNCLLATSETAKSQISIYPNPAKNVLYFSEKSNIEIYNSAGQKVKSENQIKNLDISKLSKGIYFVVLKDNSGKEIQKTKIIKE